MLLDVKEQVLVPDGIHGMPDDPRPEDLLTKADDHERIHVEAETGDGLPIGQTTGPIDLDGT